MLNNKICKIILSLETTIIILQGAKIYRMVSQDKLDADTISNLTSKIEHNITINNELIKENDRLIKEIDELLNKNKELENKIGNLENEINNLESENIKLKEISVELTGYCNCAYCCGVETGITAMGTNTKVGVIAAPSNIPLGSQLSIPELSWYKSDCIFNVEDRGGAIVQKEDGTYVIDVWFSSHQEALEFGRVKTKAYIL